jgi:site-specific DNA-methyltransferase (adenine-specific)/site-specific DNA-methyltransferase (cytosine-N4-specific)
LGKPNRAIQFLEGKLILKNMETNTIYNCDSAKLLKDTKIFPDNSIDLIITSPPYADKRKGYYDSIHPNEYVSWFLPIANELFRVLKNDGSFILNIKEHPRNGERDTYVLELILEMKKQGWFWIEEYVWYKKNSFPGKWPNRFRDSWERCLHFSKNKKFKMYQDSVKVPVGDWASKRFKSLSDKDFKRHISQTNGTLGRNVSNWINRKKVFPHNVIVFEEEHYISNVLEFATVCNNRIHSAVFPLELPTWFIKLFTKNNDIVLDPFIGSGTTAFASLGLGRQYIGIEKDEEFVNMALDQIERLKNDTNVGQPPLHRTAKLGSENE